MVRCDKRRDEMMDISIIIPTFRPKEYLWECLDAIDCQTIPHDRFEVLIVLNGERLPYENQIKAFLAQRPGLPCRVLYCEERGVSAARNLGLDEAKGTYICFMDDDDLITETYLEQLFRLASKDTIALSYITAFDDGTELYRPIYITENYQDHRERVSYKDVRRYFYVPYCKLIHRDIIGTRRYDKSLKNGEDALFMFLISDRFRWVRFAEKTVEYRYRQRPTSAFNAKRPASYYLSNMLACQHKATCIYWAHPSHYSFLFYVKYILATIMGCIRRLRNVKQ